MASKKSPAKKATPKRVVPPAPVQPPLEVTAPAKPRVWYWILLGIGLALLGTSAFLALSGTMPSWEQQLFVAVNGFEAHNWLAAQVAKPVSNAVWGILGLIVVLLVVPRFRLRAWRYGVAATGAYALGVAVEHVVGRLRPEGLTTELIARASQDGFGFPSSHVAVLTALALTVWPLVGWPWRVLLVLFVAIEAWARVFLGVHAPLDVVGGLAVGMIVVASIRLLPSKIRTFFKLGF